MHPSTTLLGLALVVGLGVGYRIMAAGYANSLLLISLWILAPTCALGHNKHTRLNEKSSRRILTKQITQLGIF